jgi:uncharacterized membrane-anchored protein
MKKILIGLFILVALVQWYVPASMILGKEKVVRKGTAFRFRTEPVDPEDPLRGRYVRLDFIADTARIPRNQLQRGEEMYAVIGNDAAGFARLDKLQKNEPETGSNYVKVQVRYVMYDSATVLVDYPFEDFYLDEYKAPKTETIYRESVSNNERPAYALVNIYRGEAVIRDLFIDNKSVYEYFK